MRSVGSQLAALFGALVVFSSGLLAADKAGRPLIPRGNRPWNDNWSGQSAQARPQYQTRTPDGDPVVTVSWTQAPGQGLPGVGRSFNPLAINGDVIAFWLRLDHSIDKLQVILTDADDVGAEQGVHTLLNEKKIEGGKWHYIVWPMKSDPGWVRYSRGRVDWNRIKGISFYTWNDQFQNALTMDVGPIQVLNRNGLETVFQQHPERVSNNRSVPWRVLRRDRPDRMLAEYYVRRATEKVNALRSRVPAKQLPKSADELRVTLARTYLMPKRFDTAQATLLRTVDVNGVQVEHQLLKTADGVYTPALVFLPPDQPGQGSFKKPGVLMLPGHGDPNWPESVQSRCLSFVKRGYVVMLVQPFGQAERGEMQTWNESHDTRATAFLLTAGESLLGLIMADHRSELGYLASRPDVDGDKLAVTGVSMGGTHSIWFSAIEPRVKAAVAVAAAPLYQPDRCYTHHGQCDTMFGVFDVADGEMISALSLPRSLLHIYPSTEAPTTEVGFRKWQEGWIGQEELMSKNRVPDAQLRKLHAYVHEAYAAAGKPDGYLSLIVQGPHDYTKTMREAAAGWMAHAFDPRASSDPIPEPQLAPLPGREREVETLNLWPHGKRPAEMLAPTAYVQRQTANLIKRLPQAPAATSDWNMLRERLRQDVAKLLGPSSSAVVATVKQLGTIKTGTGTAYQMVAQPEQGIELPMLLFAPDDKAKASGRLIVLLHPDGMGKTTSSDRRKEETRNGSWVLCVDLRGMGETRSAHESSRYAGFRDMDISIAALKLGDTVAGYWTRDLLAAIQAARQVAGDRLKVTVHGDLETGLIAILAAGQDTSIDAVSTKGLLTSCYSSEGYGLPFAYADEKFDKSVRSRDLGGYGSMVPCIPHLLKTADIPQLAALVAPRPLTIIDPLRASGNAVSNEEALKAFEWTQRIYGLQKADKALVISLGNTKPN